MSRTSSHTAQTPVDATQRLPSHAEYQLEQTRKLFEAGTTTVATHLSVDLDAAMSVALWAHLLGKSVNELHISFIRGADSIPPNHAGLDVSNGLKGSHSSCFEELMKLAKEDDRRALRNFTQHVTAQDQAEISELSYHLRVGSLGSVIGMLRGNGKSDRDIVTWAEEILKAQIVAGRDRIAAEDVVASAPRFAHGRIVLLPPDSPRTASSVAFEMGTDFVIYRQGYNVGIQRRKGVEFHLGEILSPHVPSGFFAHPNGFLLAWGTDKSPASKPCPIQAEALADLLASHLTSADNP